MPENVRTYLETGRRRVFAGALDWPGWCRAARAHAPLGSLWSPRYLVRRSAWHALDHAWEIQDRA